MKITPWSQEPVIFQEMEHAYFVKGDKKPGPSELLGMVGLSKKTDDMPEPMRSNFINAGNLGKAVHKWCEIEDKGEFDKYEAPNSRLSGYINAWRKFKTEHQFVIIEAEQARYSEYGDYCGTPDRIGTLKNTLYVIDIKTSKSINPNSRLQTMAYTYFFQEKLKRLIVQIKEDGSYQLHEQNEDGIDKDNWEAVLHVSNLIRRIK